MTGYKSTSIIVLMTVLMGTPIMGQLGNQVLPGSTTQVAEQSPFPYIGRITGNLVNIRSGPAEVYYPVGRLEPDQTIVVVEEKFENWARIEPTPQCFSYIDKTFVKLVGLAPKEGAQADQQQAEMTEAELTAKVGSQTLLGQVNGNQVRVWAGSINVVPPANACEVQTRLNFGDEVRIISARDDFYKIECPPGCYFWVALSFIEAVQPATQDNIDTIERQEQQATEEKAQAQQQLDQVSKDREEYQSLAGMLTTEMAKPMGERVYQPIRERLNKLTESTQSISIKKTCEIFSQQLTRCETGLNLWKLSHQQDQQLQDTLAKINKDKQKVELLVGANPLGAKNPDGIVVKGMLEKSAVFTAENKNQRFLVLDDDNRIAYYAVSAINGLDLSRYVGKKVSMLGQAQYDTVTRIRILRVTNIVEQSAKIKGDKTDDKTDIKTDDKKTEEKVIK
ncbi:MAG: SH3 domain-containing protein [Planctomycetes bacterium]|nr:SH3 domain-containing protein [Planctomycetota bacterium]